MLIAIQGQGRLQIFNFFTRPPHSYPPLNERDTASDYRTYWITVLGWPILNLPTSAQVDGQWLSFIPFYIKGLGHLTFRYFPKFNENLGIGLNDDLLLQNLPRQRTLLSAAVGVDVDAGDTRRGRLYRREQSRRRGGGGGWAVLRVPDSTVGKGRKFRHLLKKIGKQHISLNG